MPPPLEQEPYPPVAFWAPAQPLLPLHPLCPCWPLEPFVPPLPLEPLAPLAPSPAEMMQSRISTPEELFRNTPQLDAPAADGLVALIVSRERTVFCAMPSP